MKSIFNGKVWSTHTRAGLLSAKTEPELAILYKAVTDRIKGFIGRDPTEHEVEHGLARPPVSNREKYAANLVKALAESAAQKAAQVSPEVALLAAAKARVDEERRGKLTAAERLLEDAQASADLAAAKIADDQRRSEIKASPAFTSLRANLTELLFVSSYDPAVSAAEIEALESQSAALNETLDIKTVRANVGQLQQVIQGRIALEEVALKQAADALANRRKLIGTGQAFDAIDTELVGDLPFIALTVGDKTVKISQARYDARESDESLKASLFGGATNV